MSPMYYQLDMHATGLILLSLSTPTSVLQFHLTIVALTITCLAFFRVPEVSEFLYRRWIACEPIHSALEWVPVLDEEYIPVLRQYHQGDDAQDKSAEYEIETLQKETEQYVRFSPEELLDSNMLSKVLVSFEEHTNARPGHKVVFSPLEQVARAK